jgi:hypothetical protein
MIISIVERFELNFFGWKFFHGFLKGYPVRNSYSTLICCIGRQFLRIERNILAAG